jgi:hypothetical protein
VTTLQMQSDWDLWEGGVSGSYGLVGV